ncbi:hypothetical protein BDU57DRAFT_201131 [Ampelomyces quisqualis]|uniref:Uncharacterized protein n=1 Tax=Ampelomyces quisqualis TaxID=50730 RepID=A0A6A5QRT7_AMPQU|nr:hypothetical protein BDU57DRAFT_201131 [Ampelomyces quisqualis]
MVRSRTLCWRQRCLKPFLTRSRNSGFMYSIQYLAYFFVRVCVNEVSNLSELFENQHAEGHGDTPFTYDVGIDNVSAAGRSGCVCVATTAFRFNCCKIILNHISPTNPHRQLTPRTQSPQSRNSQPTSPPSPTPPSHTVPTPPTITSANPSQQQSSPAPRAADKTPYVEPHHPGSATPSFQTFPSLLSACSSSAATSGS